MKRLQGCWRFVLVLLVLLASVPAAAEAAASAVLDNIRARGVLRVGTTGDYKPYSFRGVDGRYAGLDVEMAASLAQSLGVRLELVATSWPTLMADFAAGRFDLAMGGISVTPERQRVALFSQPVLRDGKTALARCANAARYATLAEIDRPGVRVIVNPGGTNERYVRGHVHVATVVMNPDNVTIFDRLLAGAADVMITDAMEARLQQRLRPGLCALHPEAPFEVQDKAYLLPQDAALKAAVDTWLARVQTSGEFAAALERWLAWDWNAASSDSSAAADARLVELRTLLRERLAIGVAVAKAKWNSGAAIEDLPREADIVAGLARQAEAQGLPADWATQFFRAQIEASKTVQRELHARWRAQEQGKFSDAPDLEREVRPQLDALTPRLLAALAAARPLLCAGSGKTALDAEDASPPPDVGSAALAQALSGLDHAPACPR